MSYLSTETAEDSQKQLIVDRSSMWMVSLLELDKNDVTS